MKNIFLSLSTILFFSCHSQEKISITQVNSSLLAKNEFYYDPINFDSIEIAGVKSNLTKYRLLGAKSCNISSDKKYSNIYIEDGFHDEEGFYNGIIVVDNKDVCEITESHYKLKIDSLSYTKVHDGNFVFYTKKLSIEDFKNKYIDEYFRYEMVTQDKVEAFEKCLAIDQYTPKSVVYARNYYFAGKGIKIYNLPIKYNDIKNGIEGLPYFMEDKKKEFTECLNKLNILKINSSNIKASSIIE